MSRNGGGDEWKLIKTINIYVKRLGCTEDKLEALKNGAIRYNMTLLLTEIHCLDGLCNTCIIFAADRRISFKGNYNATRKKIFKIPFLKAGIGYFGLAEFQQKDKKVSVSDWINRFINKNTSLSDLQTFANKFANELNIEIPIQYRRNISGFHLAGYNSVGLPEFWCIRNVQDDCNTFTHNYKYEVGEHFLRRDAIKIGYDGKNLQSIQPGIIQIYRNGDIRAHVTAWNNIDQAFGTLLDQPNFKRLKTIEDYENWIKFKMELISYFYKKYYKCSIIAKPIDTFSIKGNAIT